MTDRVRSFTVILDKEYRVDDFESILNAVSQIRGVAAVEPKVIDSRDRIALITAATAIRSQLYRCISAVVEGQVITIGGEKI